MSIEIVLIPLAIAAISAWKANSSTDVSGRQTVAVGTRMRDEKLLQRALADTDAQVSYDGDVISSTWLTCEGKFTRDADGIWSVHFDGETSLEDASELVSRVDTAYGQRVQHEVLSRLRERAPAAGMEIESETIADDRSVTLVLNVNGRA
jgi:hypothetical protein